VKDLLSDADDFASERGDANLFFSAFDSEVSRLLVLLMDLMENYRTTFRCQNVS